MLYRFGMFELDEARRELRRNGVPQPMQPRVFDVLLYLVKNRERLVSKEELLNKIWPGVIVTDSSIMRAVSVIRALLREGDEPDAIQTSSRQGYRFSAEIADGQVPQTRSRSAARAHAACDRNDWEEALRLFQKIERPDALSAQDFEAWARAALYLGRPHEAILPLESAIAAHVQNADRLAAARAALTLTNVNLEARALAVAKGWHRRVAAFLADEPGETREHGMQLWLAARIALFEGDLTTALAKAKLAEAMARRLEDPDVEALGLIYRAHVELATGEIKIGLLHLDEAGAAALGGTASPWVCGIIFCSVVWAYLDRGDIGRASQWTDQFIRWSKSNTGFGYSGLCRLHRGEVLCAQGKLSEAESEINQARELLAASARYAEGDAFRVLGEIRFLRGDLDGAEVAFRQAHELGWRPLLGMAQIHAARGRHQNAIDLLQRGLTDPSWADGQRRGILLAHLAQIAAQNGLKSQARKALSELKNARDLRSAAACEASYHEARAAVAKMEGDASGAIEALRASLTLWLDIGSQIRAAHLRLRLAELLVHCGDQSEALLELTAAQKAFVKMKAAPMVLRCQEHLARLEIKT
ncbi:MAG TPA: winged helix-turn-helix domain-containing protein [Opitutaceae bacterium]|nr:winged helix-turn-helix domain-containing protein [Opitutaceae bacterium]